MAFCKTASLIHLSPHPRAFMQTLTIDQAIKQRFSTRAFTSQPVRRETIRAILDTARHAPSGVNSQPWKVYAVTGSTLTRLIAKAQNAFDTQTLTNPAFEIHPSDRPDWYKARQRKLGYALYHTLGIDKDDVEQTRKTQRRNYSFFGANAGLLITVPNILGCNAWGHVGHFVQNVCLASLTHGLDTCLQESWAKADGCVRSVLPITNDETLWCGIAIGYQDQSHPINTVRAEKIPVEDFTTFYE